MSVSRVSILNGSSDGGEEQCVVDSPDPRDKCDSLSEYLRGVVSAFGRDEG